MQHFLSCLSIFLTILDRCMQADLSVFLASVPLYVQKFSVYKGIDAKKTERSVCKYLIRWIIGFYNNKFQRIDDRSDCSYCNSPSFSVLLSIINTFNIFPLWKSGSHFYPSISETLFCFYSRGGIKSVQMFLRNCCYGERSVYKS